jgi:hypothetical protein
VRRLAPRSLQGALDRVSREAAPPGVLAGAQACWVEVAGPVLADEAEPVSEREGIVTVAFRSAVWAQELELLAGDLRDRLNAAIGASQGTPSVRGLRFVVGFPTRSGGRA